jgi:hypothetical protein
MNNKAYFLEIIQRESNNKIIALYKYNDSFLVSAISTNKNIPIYGHIAQVRFNCKISPSSLQNHIEIYFVPVLDSEYSFKNDNEYEKSSSTQEEAFNIALAETIKYQEMLFEITTHVHLGDRLEEIQFLNKLKSDKIKGLSDFFAKDPIPCAAHYLINNGEGLRFDKKSLKFEL